MSLMLPGRPHIFQRFDVRNAAKVPNAAREVPNAARDVRNAAREVPNAAREVRNAARLTWQH